jgi:hypothetical protein
MSAPKPIILHARYKSRTTDDAGTTIIKSAIANTLTCAGPYEDVPLRTPRHSVPSLAYFCVRRLVDTPEQVHSIGKYRTSCASNRSHSKNTLRQLTRHRGPWEDLDWSTIDPRLWAVMAQVFSDLPDALRTYSIALSDKYLPLLQEIPSSSHFSLVTILVLPGCREMGDDTITELRHLPSLCYLDISTTSVSSHGIERLARTLDLGDGTTAQRQGPWGLRVIKLVDCDFITKLALPSLTSFPLLSLVGT